MRQLTNEAFLKSRPEALSRPGQVFFADPKTVLGLRPNCWPGLTENFSEGSKGVDRATEAATGISGENSGVANLTPFKPGQIPLNLAGCPQGDGLMRKRLMKALLATRRRVMAAMATLVVQPPLRPGHVGASGQAGG